MASPAKICAVALLLVAGSADGRIPLRRSGCSCNHRNSYPTPNNRHSYGIRHTPTRHLMSSLMSDPWFGHLDLWHDPGSLGHWLPLGLSHRPWRTTGLESLFEPSCSSKDGILGHDFRLGCHRCQEVATDASDGSRGDTEIHEERNDQGTPGQHQEAGRRHAQPTEDQARRNWKEQEIEQQRLQQERQRLKEEAELNRCRQEEDRRLQEERRRRQQRLREEEMEKRRRSKEEGRWRQRQEAEAARIQRDGERMEKRRRNEEEQRWRQRQEAEEARIQQDRERMEKRRRSEEEQRWRQRQEAEDARIQQDRERLRRAQEEKASYESRHREMPRGHPNQGMKTDSRHIHENNQKNQRGQYRMIEVASLKIPGYAPEDITVTKTGNRLTVQGKHVCDCQESCTEREFQRGFAIPRNVNPASLEASLTQDGELTVTGNQATAPVQPTNDFIVKVQGDGFFPPRSKNTDSTCGGRRKGFKLKKMNKRTGEIVDNVQDLEVDMDDRTFEDEVDEDGVTMEVEY